MFFKVTVFLLMLVMFFPNVYAQQSTDPCGTTTFDCYQESGFRLNSDPVICLDLDVDRNLKGKLQAYVQVAVTEWEEGLSSNSGNIDWNIQLIPLASSDYCNITLQFIAFPTPDQQKSPDIMGRSILNPNHTAHIEIFYNSADTEGKLIWTIKHELGHAFGLGHYMISNDEYDQNFVYSKSIMIPITLSPWVMSGATMDVRPVITSMDIEQLKSLYNNNGFTGYTESFQPHPQTSTTPPMASPQDTTPPQIPQVNQLEKYIIIQDLKRGSLSDDAFTSLFFSLNTDGFIQIDNGHKYLGYLVKPMWIDKVVTYWAEDLISDQEFGTTLQYLFDADILQL